MSSLHHSKESMSCERGKRRRHASLLWKIYYNNMCRSRSSAIYIYDFFSKFYGFSILFLSRCVALLSYAKEALMYWMKLWMHEIFDHEFWFYFHHFWKEMRLKLFIKHDFYLFSEKKTSKFPITFFNQINFLPNPFISHDPPLNHMLPYELNFPPLS